MQPIAAALPFFCFQRLVRKSITLYLYIRHLLPILKPSISSDNQTMNSLGEVVNHAMELVEEQSQQLKGILPKDYTIFTDELLSELLRIFNNSALDDVGGDVIGRIYEYFLNKFAKNIASDDGVFFTPKSLVKMIVNIIEPSTGVLLDKTVAGLIQKKDLKSA